MVVLVGNLMVMMMILMVLKLMMLMLMVIVEGVMLTVARPVEQHCQPASVDTRPFHSTPVQSQ